MAFLPAIPAIFASLTAATTAAAAGTTAAVGTGIAGASTLAAASIPAITGISTASVAAGAASAVPAWLGTAGIAGSALSGVVGAYGAVSSADATAKASNYNAQIAERDAAVAHENSDISAQSGEEQVAMQQLKTRAEVGDLLANEAASGLDVNKGSSVEVRASATELGQLDALNVRANATREAFGYSTQSENFKAQSGVDRAEAANDKTAGVVNAASTLLGSESSAATNYYKYKLNGGFGF